MRNEIAVKKIRKKKEITVSKKDWKCHRAIQGLDDERSRVAAECLKLTAFKWKKAASVSASLFNSVKKHILLEC